MRVGGGPGILAASLLVLASFALLLARFAWLQLVRHDDYAARAEQNRIALVPLTPNRGVIRDRVLQFAKTVEWQVRVRIRVVDRPRRSATHVVPPCAAVRRTAVPVAPP